MKQLPRFDDAKGIAQFLHVPVEMVWNVIKDMKPSTYKEMAKKANSVFRVFTTLF